ncbi:MAG: hypothetical protein QM796_20735 [Chthoniobacteraceae bacterium]
MKNGLIELLENRIAPASLYTYTDVDGDQVTIKASKGNLQAVGVVNLSAGQLQLLDLTDASFTGADITFKVTKVSGGDGLANVGYINASGHTLGKVVVAGDLGQINAGNNDGHGTAIQLLSVQSMGAAPGGGNAQSDIVGSLGALKVAGDFSGQVFVEGKGCDINSVKIGGSLLGGSGDYSGYLSSDGNIGTVTIQHDLQGGDGQCSGMINSGGNIGTVKIGGNLAGGTSGGFSGVIFSNKKLAGVTIGGSVIGTGAGYTGYIFSSEKMGKIKITGSVTGIGDNSGSIKGTLGITSVSIGGSLKGGTGVESGEISGDRGKIGTVEIGGNVDGGGGEDSGHIYGSSLGKITIHGSIIGGTSRYTGLIESMQTADSITIDGSVEGGTGEESGVINCDGDIGSIKIGGDLQGGSISGTDSLDDSGTITSVFGKIASIAIGGSIIAGTNTGTGSLTDNTTIHASQGLGSLDVSGNISGNEQTMVVISADKTVSQNATMDVAIHKITVGGSVAYTNVLAGYGYASGIPGISALNGDAQIGTVIVGGNWQSSSIVAGATNTASGNQNFGDSNDAAIATGNPKVLSKIATIVIGAGVSGTLGSGDYFGMVAEEIGNLKINGQKVALAAGPDNDDTVIDGTNDMAVHEV